MARLSKLQAPGHWTLYEGRPTGYRCADVDQQGNIVFPETQCADQKTHAERENKSLGELPQDSVWKTRVADGYAYYYVRSQTPHVVLSHVHYGDCWHALPATIRRLRRNELPQDIQRQKWYQELFRKDEAEKNQAKREQEKSDAQAEGPAVDG